MANFKKLHDDWKKAKSDLKSVYDAWARLFTDVTQAHKKVTVSVPSFPKFDKDLGPSLEKLEKDKEVDKSLKKAETAIEQYEDDLKGLATAVTKKADLFQDEPPPEGKKITPGVINTGFGKFVKKAQDVLKEIKEAVKERIEEHKEEMNENNKKKKK